MWARICKSLGGPTIRQLYKKGDDHQYVERLSKKWLAADWRKKTYDTNISLASLVPENKWSLGALFLDAVAQLYSLGYRRTNVTNAFEITLQHGADRRCLNAALLMRGMTVLRVIKISLVTATPMHMWLPLPLLLCLLFLRGKFSQSFLPTCSVDLLR